MKNNPPSLSIFKSEVSVMVIFFQCIMAKRCTKLCPLLWLTSITTPSLGAHSVALMESSMSDNETGSMSDCFRKDRSES